MSSSSPSLIEQSQRERCHQEDQEPGQLLTYQGRLTYDTKSTASPRSKLTPRTASTTSLGIEGNLKVTNNTGSPVGAPFGPFDSSLARSEGHRLHFLLKY